MRLQPSFMVFKNANRCYPSRNFDEKVPGVTYRSVSKGLMDSDLFWQWMEEPCIFKPIEGRRRRILFAGAPVLIKSHPWYIKRQQRRGQRLHFFLSVQQISSSLRTISSCRRLIKNEKKMKQWSDEGNWNRMWANAREGSGRLLNQGKAYLHLGAEWS